MAYDDRKPNLFEFHLNFCFYELQITLGRVGVDVSDEEEERLVHLNFHVTVAVWAVCVSHICDEIAESLVVIVALVLFDCSVSCLGLSCLNYLSQHLYVHL